jgi:hypothetical protein
MLSASTFEESSNATYGLADLLYHADLRFVETTFCIKLTSIGLHFGMPAKGDTTFEPRVSNCNVVVMAILAFAVVALVVLKPK